MKSPKTIGFLADYLNFRVDCIKLIQKLSEEFDVIVFCSERNAKFVPKGVEMRVIDFQMRKRRNLIWRNFAMMFCQVPNPNKYYFLKQWINLFNQKSSSLKSRCLYWARRILPKIITFDFYLSYLIQESEYNLSKIDVFFICTPHEQDLFLAQISKTTKPILAYIHSWDHIYKFQKISCKRFRYLTWNESLKDDLSRGFGIESKNISIIGSSQLAIIELISKELSNEPMLSVPKYFYFVASFAQDEAVRQEVKIIQDFCKTLQSISKDIKVVFRPYPNLKDQRQYDSLKRIANLEFDYYKPDQTKSLLSLDDIKQKFKMIRNALAVVHAGTTVGLEAAHMNVPVIYINYLIPSTKQANVPLTKYWEQYHLKKYYLQGSAPNVVTDSKDLSQVLERMITNDRDFLIYSEDLAHRTKTTSFHEITQALSNLIG